MACGTDAEPLSPVEAAVLQAVGDNRARPHRIAGRLCSIIRNEVLYDALERSCSLPPVAAASANAARSPLARPR
jgi:hypothetical protein